MTSKFWRGYRMSECEQYVDALSFFTLKKDVKELRKRVRNLEDRVVELTEENQLYKNQLDKPEPPPSRLVAEWKSE